MRQITKDAATALKKGIAFKRANTEVVDYGAYQVLKLHGHTIAVRDGHELRLNMCGWETVTTRERLNGILEVFEVNARIYQEKFNQYLWWNGAGCGHYPIDSQRWIHFLVINPAKTPAPKEWNPARYFGQGDEAHSNLLNHIEERKLEVVS